MYFLKVCISTAFLKVHPFLFSASHFSSTFSFAKFSFFSMIPTEQTRQQDHNSPKCFHATPLLHAATSPSRPKQNHCRKHNVSPHPLSHRLKRPLQPVLKPVGICWSFSSAREAARPALRQLFPWPPLYLQHCVHICSPLCLVLNHCSAPPLPGMHFVPPSMSRLDGDPKAICKPPPLAFFFYFCLIFL